MLDRSKITKTKVRTAAHAASRFCVFHKTGPDDYRCINCGRSWHDAQGLGKPIVRPCLFAPQPNIPQKMKHPVPPAKRIAGATSSHKIEAGNPSKYNHGRFSGINGPGDYLREAIAKWVGKQPEGNCGCQDRINLMNKNGTKWCRDNMETIVGWLLDAANKPRPIYKMVKDKNGVETKQKVGESNWWKYATAVPGSRLFIKWMVLSAIVKAEKAAKSASDPKAEAPAAT